MSEETIVIDPVAMNITNRIAQGTTFVGNIECAGGLMVQGKIIGDVKVTDGPLVLMEDGVISGSIQCDKDAYLFGEIITKSDGSHSDLTAGNTVFLANSVVAKADISAAGFKTYAGANVEGKFVIRK